MSTATTTTGATSGPPLQDLPVPLARLVRVELRKLTDTRSGRWLLLAIAVITAAVVAVFLFASPAKELTYANFLSATATPQGLLLPILGILTVTSEWSQRTGLVTFTLEPNRGRVVIAKLTAVVLLGAATAGIALALAALGNVLGLALRHGDGSWTLGLAGVRDVLVAQVIGVVQGLALGMLTMSAAGAIVTYFALPTVMSILINTAWFAKVGRWIDLSTTSRPLSNHEMDADAWARLGLSVLIWVLLPLLLGWLRLLRREIKSA